nr:FCD domain-containing protein [Leucobacter exalbidus]
MSRIRPQKTALLVAQRIVKEITEAGKQPGDRLDPEHIMLETYGIGRGTLRESLRILELQGVISLKPGSGGGPIVQKPDSSVLASSLTLLLHYEKRPFASVVETRTVLEPAMAKFAAENASPDQLEALRLNVETVEAHLDDDVYYHRENERFHAILAEASGNSIFQYLIAAMLGILDGTTVGVTYPREVKELSNKIHRDIYDAIANRDGVRAEKLMRSHLHAHADYTATNFPASLDAPIDWMIAGG